MTRLSDEAVAAIRRRLDRCEECGGVGIVITVFKTEGPDDTGPCDECVPIRALLADRAALVAEVERLEAQRDAMGWLLRRVEWSRPSDYRTPDGRLIHQACCPVCGAVREKGHSATCELAGVLAATPPPGPA